MHSKYVKIYCSQQSCTRNSVFLQHAFYQETDTKLVWEYEEELRKLNKQLGNGTCEEKTVDVIEEEMEPSVLQENDQEFL